MKWDGKTDSGSEYFALRQKGYSHQDAVDYIEGRTHVTKHGVMKKNPIRKNLTMNELFKVGDRVYGFCNGFFGRDCYESKLCVFVTERYAVFEDIDDGYGRVLNLVSEEESLKRWRNKNQFKEWTQEWKKEQWN